MKSIPCLSKIVYPFHDTVSKYKSVLSQIRDVMLNFIECFFFY